MFWSIAVVWITPWFLHRTGASVVRSLGCRTEHPLAEEVGRVESVASPSEEDKQRMRVLQGRKAGFRTLLADYSGVTVQVCVQRCWVARFSYAGIQAGQRCFCAHKLLGTQETTDDLCYHRCSGNCRQRCGGDIALSVYDTGYEREPPLKHLPLDKALLACRPEVPSDSVCGKSPGKGRRRRFGFGMGNLLTTVREKTFRQPDLFSPRMSPLLCVTYCRRTSRFPNAIAAFRDATTCCCSKVWPHDWWEYADKLLPFQRFCDQPCGDRAAKPRCVGWYRGNHLSAVFSLRALKGQPPSPTIRGNENWLAPQWPAGETWERAEYRPVYRQPVQDAPTLVEEEGTTERTNTSLNTTHEPGPGQEGGGQDVVVVVVVGGGILLAALIGGVVHHRRSRSPKHFKLPDKMPATTAGEGGDASGPRTKRKKRKKKKKRKRRERAEGDLSTNRYVCVYHTSPESSDSATAML